SDSAEDHFICLDVEQRNKTSERSEAVMHSDHSPAARVGRYCREERCHWISEANFFTFHVAARLGLAVRGLNSHFLGHWISAVLSPVADESASEKEVRHRCKDRPTLACIPYHLAERIRESRAENEDQSHLQQIRKWRGILVRVRRICIGVSAAVSTQHLYRQL